MPKSQPPRQATSHSGRPSEGPALEELPSPEHEAKDSVASSDTDADMQDSVMAGWDVAQSSGWRLRGKACQGGAPPPPLAGTYPIHREQKNYWRMNNSAHGNVMLSAVNKGNSSLNVNSGFPHLTNTQQLQQSGTFTISCQ